MANIKSAAKRARQSVRRKTRNQQNASAIRTFEKKVRAAIAGKKVEEAQAALIAFSSKIDRAAKSGVVHYKKASRKIGQLSKHVQSLIAK
jgi:small subunit ribosomal protein S20